MPTVKDFVKECLEEYGYGGLYNEEDGCACETQDLAPCGSIKDDCQAGFLEPCDCGDHDFHVVVPIEEEEEMSDENDNVVEGNFQNTAETDPEPLGPFDHVEMNEAKHLVADGFRAAYGDLLSRIEDEVENSRSRALAITKLEESAMWLMKAISRS